MTRMKAQEPGVISESWRGQKLGVVIIFAILSCSFLHGWYVDTSTAGATGGWADQALYVSAASDIATGDLPSRGALHFQMLYPLMGALGHLVLPADPFMPVSFLFLLGSSCLVYLGARHLLGWSWALAVVGVVFVWDLHGRTFNYPSELFVIPWNNQVVFFALAYFFWLLATKVSAAKGTISPWLYLASGLITGVTIGTREESALFVVPLLLYFLVKSKANLRMWALATGSVLVGYLPHLVIKTIVLGDLADTGRTTSYIEALRAYMSWDRLSTNVLDVLVSSSARGVDANRIALLEAAPWLWLSPLGLVLYLSDRTQDGSIKVYLLVSIGLLFFYLAGENMSLDKLKFHCIRYLTPALIGMNFTVIYAYVFAAKRIRAKWRRGSPDRLEQMLPR